MQPLIKVRNLEKCVKTKAGPLYLLRQINLDIEQGEFIAIVGPSGGGKSTVLSILGLYDGDWNGEYEFNGRAVHEMSPKERATLNKRHTRFVFQQFNLLDDLTVAENLDVPLSCRDVKKSVRQAIVADTLDRFGIVAKKDLFPAQLSGGSNNGSP